jgi:uncharacterized protein DUF6314
VPDLKAFLAGDWTIDRLVLDRANGMEGQFEGRAHFTLCGSALLYEEHGTLTFGEHRGRSGQSYRYDFPEGDGRANVHLRDGRPFHSLDLSQGQDFVSHACHPDLYDGRFVALGSSSWRSTWTVKGPRKDYDLVTMYVR